MEIDGPAIAAEIPRGISAAAEVPREHALGWRRDVAFDVGGDVDVIGRRERAEVVELEPRRLGAEQHAALPHAGALRQRCAAVPADEARRSWIEFQIRLAWPLEVVRGAALH